MADESASKTSRGFGLLEFQDHNGVQCSLQESSAIDFNTPDAMERPGSSLIWLGCDKADPKYFVPNGNPSWRRFEMPDGYIANTRMHLDRPTATMVRDALTQWLETGVIE